MTKINGFKSMRNDKLTTFGNIMYKTLEFNWLNEAFCSTTAFVSGDRLKSRNPQYLIHTSINGNYQKYHESKTSKTGS